MKEHPPLVPGWTAFDRRGGSSPQPFLSFSIIPFVGVFSAGGETFYRLYLSAVPFI